MHTLHLSADTPVPLLLFRLSSSCPPPPSCLLPRYEDPVPEILPEHFEMAMSEARRSVSDQDLMKYSGFAQSLQQQRGQLLGGADRFTFPESAMGGGGGDGGGNAAGDDDDDEEDLYS